MKLDMVSTSLFFVVLSIIVATVIGVITFKKLKSTLSRSFVIAVLVSSVLMLILGAFHFINQTKSAINIPIATAKHSNKQTTEVITSDTSSSSSSSQSSSSTSSSSSAESSSSDVQQSANLSDIDGHTIDLTIYDKNHTLTQSLKQIQVISHTSNSLTYVALPDTLKHTINFSEDDTLEIK